MLTLYFDSLLPSSRPLLVSCLSPYPQSQCSPSLQTPSQAKERARFFKKVATLHDMTKDSLNRLDAFSTMGRHRFKSKKGVWEMTRVGFRSSLGNLVPRRPPSI